jgi:hypothetical protein
MEQVESPVAPASSADHGRAVQSVVRRLLRRGVLIGLLGLAMAVGFVVAYRSNNRSVSAKAKIGVELDAEVLKYVASDPAQVTVRYRFKDDEAGSATVTISLPALSRSYTAGESIRVVARDKNDETKTTIASTEKTSTVTSVPAAVLFVSALSLLAMGVFEVQSALRALQHLKRGSWKTWTWRGAVDGPGRGHVNAAGYVTSPDRSEAHLLVNARGCWREGIDLLEGKAVIHVNGNPNGHVLVRHPAALRPVILRPPKGHRQQREAMHRIESRVDRVSSAPRS